MYFVYIIYSATRDRYYVGSCQNVSEHLVKHNTNHGGYTSKTGDWIIKLIENYLEKSAALMRGKQIKAWKSRKMIEKLIAEI